MFEWFLFARKVVEGPPPDGHRLVEIIQDKTVTSTVKSDNALGPNESTSEVVHFKK